MTNELKSCKRTYRPLALPVYPIFEEEKSNGSDEKLVEQKIALLKTTVLLFLQQTSFESN